VAMLVEDGERLGLDFRDLDALRHLVAAAQTWAFDAREHLDRFPATTAQPTDALPAAEHLIQASPLAQPARLPLSCCTGELASAAPGARMLTNRLSGSVKRLQALAPVPSDGAPPSIQWYTSQTGDEAHATLRVRSPARLSAWSW